MYWNSKDNCYVNKIVDLAIHVNVVKVEKYTSKGYGKVIKKKKPK